MSHAVSSIERAFSRVRDDPAPYIGLAFAVVFVTSIINFIPLIGGFIALVVMPYLYSGLYGTYVEFRDADNPSLSIERFTDNGSEWFVPILLAMFLVGLGVTVLAIVLIIVLAMGGAFMTGMDGSSAAAGSPVPMLIMIGVIFLGMACVSAMVQFYMVAIVRDDLGALGGLKKSVSIFVENTLDVIIFTALLFIISILSIGIPAILVGVVVAGIVGSEGGFVAFLLLIPLYVAISSAVSAISCAAQVEFYETVRSEPMESSGTPATDDEGGWEERDGQ